MTSDQWTTSRGSPSNLERHIICGTNYNVPFNEYVVWPAIEVPPVDLRNIRDMSSKDTGLCQAFVVGLTRAWSTAACAW